MWSNFRLLLLLFFKQMDSLNVLAGITIRWKSNFSISWNFWARSLNFLWLTFNFCILVLIFVGGDGSSFLFFSFNSSFLAFILFCKDEALSAMVLLWVEVELKGRTLNIDCSLWSFRDLLNYEFDYLSRGFVNPLLQVSLYFFFSFIPFRLFFPTFSCC